MTLLQVIFIVSAFVIFLLGIDIARRQKFNFLHVFIFIWISILLVIFTLYPPILNKVWEIFGTQRWADVLVYLSIIFLLYFALFLFNKIEKNREDITLLVRELAIENSSKRIVEWKEAFVIPCYNEWPVIKENISNILKQGYRNILVINDGSTDDSRRILESFWDKIILLNHLINRGQGAALETGFEYLRRYWKVNYVVCYDADWQHDLNDLHKFYKVLDKYKDVDIVFWSRFIGKTDSNIPLLRKIILKLAVLFTFFVSRIRLTDAHNWYRVFRWKILDKIRITIDWMGHASEIADIVAREKIKYKEVPVNIKYTAYSLSKWQKSLNAINIALRMIWNKFFK